MSKFEAALSRIKKGYADYQVGKTSAVLISEHNENDLNLALEALTQAAEIERGDKVVVDRELTAENGMKKRLSGEFFEQIDVDDGTGHYLAVKVPVSWTTIKEIHKSMITASEGK